jgi:hypothetical protein
MRVIERREGRLKSRKGGEIREREEREGEREAPQNKTKIITYLKVA